MRFPLRRRSDVVLVVVDVASAVLAAAAAYRLRFEGQVVPAAYVADYLGTSLAVSFGWVASARAGGLYRRAVLRPGSTSVEPAFAAALATGVALVVVNTAVVGGRLSRAWIGLVVLALLLFGAGSRVLLRRVRRTLAPLGVALERYLLVGDDATGRRLLGDLTRAPGAPYRVVEVLASGTDPAVVVARARAGRVDGIVLPTGMDPAYTARLASLLSGASIDVLLAPGFGQLDTRVASIAMLHGVPLLRVAGLSPQRRATRESPRDRGRRGVAILGTRGVPANYGGFETFAERLALGLVEQGVPVTVYCRRHYATGGEQWRGVRLVTLPTIRSKYLDTVVHTFLSAAHLVGRAGPRDVVLCNAANAPVVPLLRLFRRRVVLNVDGLEWRRTKWGIAGRSWYRMGEWLSVRLASVLVTDAEEVRTYYRVRHDTDSVMIPYGADLLDRDAGELPGQLGVRQDGYALYVSRWERENNPLMVAAAHARSGSGLDLVMLGESTYDSGLDAEVRAAAGPRAHFPGALYGEAYRALQTRAACYVHATEVGGTHPALIEALGAGNLCLVLDTPENREVVGDAGRYFVDEDGLVQLLDWVATLTREERRAWGERARAGASERYSWAAVTKAYLEVLGRPVGSG